MKKIRKKQLMRWGRQVLSYILIVALLAGLIPGSVYAKKQVSEATQKEYTSQECTIMYKETSAWGNYVGADVTITNHAPYDKSLWKVEFDFLGTIDNIWNADILSAKDGHYVIAAKNYNSTIEAGKTVSFGFMAYGENGKPKMPETISFVKEESENESEENKEAEETPEEEGEDGKTEQEDNPGYEIPEKWAGLNYALFTAGDKKLSMYTASTNITGVVHTNKDFYYQGSVLQINGVLEASEGITLRTSDGEDALKIASKKEKAPKIAMPDISKEVCAYTAQSGTLYEGNKDFNSNKIVIEKPVGISGNVVFNTTSFLGKGIVYAEENVTYNVADLATPEDSRVFIMAKNGNITLNGSNINLNAVLYAPNGCVYINTANLNLNGRIIAKQVVINGSNINIHAGPYDYDMLEFLFKPEIDVEVDGNQKENRKVTLSVAEISNTEYIQKEETVWNISKDGTDALDCYVIDEEHSDVFHKELIFKEAGTYTVAVTVTTGKVKQTVTKELVIANDLAPTAGFTLESWHYSRNNEGKATISLNDCSSSADGDNISERIWTIQYDENNDGVFDENISHVVSGNELQFHYETDKVGKYKVALQVTETFEDTIPKLLEDDAYKKDDTTELEEKACVFEVGNEAPLANLDIEKAKSADIVFTVGETDKETLAVYSEQAEALKEILKEKGIDAKVDTVSTSVLTAQDTFAWKEYDHYNYADRYLPTLEKHIIYDDKDIQMLGYSWASLKDFLYIADENPGKKTFEFDLQRDRTDWHSMEGGGFLFNTTVDEEKDTIKGFCILVTQSGLKLVQINCNRLSAFRNGSYNWVQSAGKLLKTYSIGNVYDNHHFKIVTDKNTISVWDGEKLVIDNFILPENDYGYGFGPIISHASHGCSQQSYFTFKNITMETMTGSSLSDIVNGYEWRPGASHYVINLSDTEVPELSSEEETADLAAALIKNDAAFIGIGNENNESQYLTLLNAVQTGGMYLPAENIADAMNKTNGYLTESILAKEYAITDYITTDDIVTYKGYYQDAESDAIYEQKWEYEYDPSIFASENKEAEHIIRAESEPITVFEHTGAYAIRLNIRDNPVGENDALDEYRKWSGTDEYEKLLVVQSRPVAQVSIEVTKNTADTGSCIANAVYTASDPDHVDDENKGIREEYFYYKNVKDGAWSEGKLPNRLTVGETYLVKYQVKDMEGSLSFPATAVVKTSDLLVYEDIVDELPPEVFIDVVKEEISVGEELRIDGYALDDYGVETFELYLDGEKMLDSFGRVHYTAGKEGTVIVKAVATDIGGNAAEKELIIKVVDRRDKTAPTAEITSPTAGSEIGFNIQIQGTAKDETKFKKYTLSYKEEKETEYHVFEESTDSVSDGILGSLDITDFVKGNYEILLTVEDAAGNVSYSGITLYIESSEIDGSGNTGNNGETDGYTLRAEISDITLSENNIHVTGCADAEGYMKQYTLSYQSEHAEEMTTVAQSTKELTNGLLGAISTEKLASGSYKLLLMVEDKQGNSVSANGTFTYTEGKTELKTELAPGTETETKPEADQKKDFTSPEAKLTGLMLADDNSIINIYATVKDEKELKEYTLSYAKEGEEEYTNLATGTEAIENAKIAELATEDLEDGNYILRLEAWDMAGNGVVCKRAFTYQKGSEQIEVGEESETEVPKVPEEPVEPETPTESVTKEFALALSHSAAGTGTNVQAQITLPANIKEETLKIFMGDTQIATGTNKTTFTSDKAGKVQITATGVTEEGEEKKVTAICTFYNLSDKNAPTAAITAPSNEQILTKPVDITGSAYDNEELDSWKLEYRMKGTDAYTLLAEGTQNKKDEVLAHFDTTMLLNGSYEVRLTVLDKGGNRRTLERDYMVEGELKVGAMNLGFTDITAQMAGTTVLVNRMYDSRNKKQGDFGIGWTLGMQGMELTESNDLADGYELVRTGSLFSTGYQMTETKSHDVVVTYGDGTSDRFEITFTPERKALVPITEVKLGYRCVTNQKVKLEIVEDTTAHVYGNGIVFYEESIYDIRNYKLTTEEGNEIYLNTEKGVYKIVDTSGNVITVDENGYHAKNGKNIIFTRDEENRIKKAEDPNGNITTYQYDEEGNLASVTDAANRTVSFTYDKKHNLISITDPMGIATARNEYDENGRLTATIDADGNRMEYTYDVEGKTQTVKDRMGNTTVYTYDDNGNILQTIDAYGNKTNNTYDENNNLLSTTDARGNTTGYAYDKNGNVTEVTAPDGTKAESTYTQENQVSGIRLMDTTVMAMKYDDKGRITSIEDANGNETAYSYTTDGKLTGLTDEIGTYQKVTYDADGNVATTTNGAGESATYTYDKDGRCTNVTISREENGQTLTFTSHYTYNEAGDIIQSVDNAGNITTYEYDANGNRTASVDAKGRRITYAYDTNGNLIKIIYPDGTNETFTYDANGNNTAATDRNGLQITMKYDKLNRLVQKTNADGTKETYTYDEVGNVTEQISASGAKTSYNYDSRNRNTTITDALGNVTTFTYDEASRLTKRTDAKGNEISYTYDANGNIIRTTYADGNSITSTYDARNRVTKQEDQNGNETLYEYDGADRLTKVTDAYGNSYTYGYDANGNLVTVTDANEHVTRYTYDEVGRVATIQNALGKTMEYTYDKTGNITTFKDYAGNVTTYVYDEMDRVVEKRVDADKTTYAYNEKGQLTSVSDNSGITSYTYDTYSRLSTVTDTRGNTLTYAYDEAGRLKTLETDYGTTTYEYDILDRVTRVIDRNGKATIYEYDALGNRSAVRYPNGNVATYTYDACQQLKEEWITDANGVTLAKYSYGLGKAGERTTITEVSGESETQITYKYDKLNRLVKETIERDGNRLTNEYGYDAVSNRTTKKTTIKGDISVLADVESEDVKITEGETTYTYNALNQLVTETTPEGVITYTYDNNGNLIKQTGDKTVNYTYDKENHLLRATIQKGNNVTVETYTYDYAGNRTSKTINEKDTTYYLIDTSDSLTMVMAETDAAGNETAYYTRGEELLSMEKDGKVWYYLQDGHGSIRALTDETGIITDRYSYDAYGNLLEKEGETKNEFLYTGEQYNANTGLYYLRARYMNPSTGTFISMDSYQGSIYDPVTLHKYLYANANPVKYTDPSGYFSIGECSVATSIKSTLSTMHNTVMLRKILKWADAMCTVYDVAMEIRNAILGGGTVIDVIGALLKGVVVGFMVDGMCKTSLGIILKPMMAIFGLSGQVDQIQKAIESGDPAEIAVRFVQLICMLFGLTSQCFTGDTLVATEEGLRPIEEIHAGEYVWSENTETGEKELKKVLVVSATETDTLVKVTTTNGTQISTTENHPFYVEGEGWKVAAELETGDVLRTQDGKEETVASVEVEEQQEQVKVYNLEIEDSHTYYVSKDEVLVHNECGEYKEYDIVPYDTNQKTPGFEKHHGVLNKWAENNIPGYTKKNAPTLLLSKDNHKMTKEVYREWLRLNYGKPVGVSPDWKNISKEVITKLAKEMFDVAGVPEQTRNEYFELFDLFCLGQ